MGTLLSNYDPFSYPNSPKSDANESAFEDISVPWGQSTDPLEHQFGKWRFAHFRDMAESLDASKLYFLYEPAYDGRITTADRKGTACLVVFDTQKKCFVAEIPLNVEGRVSCIFALNTPSPAGGTMFVLVTFSEEYERLNLHTWRVNLNADGLSLMGEPFSLMTTPIIIDFGAYYLCLMREDRPELVVGFGPGMTVVRIDAETSTPKEPIQSFNVQGAEISHYPHEFVIGDNIYFLSTSPDGNVDLSCVHVLSLETCEPISTHHCQPDPICGMPSGRKQPAVGSIGGFILIAGGEIHYGDEVTHIADYWALDITKFQWKQIHAQMPFPLIEPRLKIGNSGNVYLWSDSIKPPPGEPHQGTNVRIIRLRGFHPMKQAAGDLNAKHECQSDESECRPS